ncbi:hypothetical protein HXX76_012459 [Chlamydomonas incerta]|uniref:Uncharacterized protein n=1 Tax=Chlamydomonas incerta TaxID=51695 RepID=A0A835SPC4_CHLIN|nr:hypothetical protein HXX76_012459 [Chlamydomonas incerta]|eukprot:KAG2427263.1 hypothetical protein HXX76_012459 [Chlamydomonas incerta]
MHNRVLKGMNRRKLTSALSRLGARFSSGPVSSAQIVQKQQMEGLLASRPDIEQKVATLMDPKIFAKTMDKYYFQRNVDAHVNTDQQLKADMEALVEDGVVDLFESELPDECQILRQHDRFLGILPTPSPSAYSAAAMWPQHTGSMVLAKLVAQYVHDRPMQYDKMVRNPPYLEWKEWKREKQEAADRQAAEAAAAEAAAAEAAAAAPAAAAAKGAAEGPEAPAAAGPSASRARWDAVLGSCCQRAAFVTAQQPGTARSVHTAAAAATVAAAGVAASVAAVVAEGGKPPPQQQQVGHVD